MTARQDGLPPLGAAREIAREMLARYRVVDLREPRAVIEAYTALHITLAQLLGALDSNPQEESP